MVSAQVPLLIIDIWINCLRYKPGVPQITSRLSCDRCHIFDTTYTSTYDKPIVRTRTLIWLYAPCLNLLGDYWMLLPYKTTCPSLINKVNGSNYLLPGTFQNYRLLLLTICGFISLEKFFARFFSRYKLPCYIGKCKRYESNIPQQVYKTCPITAWVLLQNESERIRTFNILPPARSLSNTRFPCARLPFRHTLLNGISAVSNIFFMLCHTLFRITVRKSGQSF